MLINYTQTDGLHFQVFNPSPTNVTLKRCCCSEQVSFLNNRLILLKTGMKSSSDITKWTYIGRHIRSAPNSKINNNYLELLSFQGFSVAMVSCYIKAKTMRKRYGIIVSQHNLTLLFHVMIILWQMNS